MRMRTTWNPGQIKQAAMNRQADPYQMNQDHPNPPTSKYMNGDPSSWAEDPHPSTGTWEAEYAGGQVKRDEVGLPEMRKDTFNHPEKTASEQEKALLTKKATLAEKTARLMLAGKKAASEEVVESQAWALMQMPDADLMATYTRLADDQGEKPWEKKDEDEQGKQAQDQQQQGQAEQKQASPAPAPVAAPAPAAAAPAAPAMVPVADVEKIVQAAIKKAMDDQALAQQQMQQAQQQLQQQAQQQQQQPMAQQQPGQQQPMAQQQMDPLAQQQQQQPMADDQMLDEMLAEQQPVGMGEVDIELDAPQMDVGELGLGPEDDVLTSLFATQEVQDAEKAKQAQEQGQQDQGGQQKQAGVKTASRTIGTRPTTGVGKVGGGVHGTRTASEGADRLSSIWQTAPDVREVFGTRLQATGPPLRSGPSSPRDA